MAQTELSHKKATPLSPLKNFVLFFKESNHDLTPEMLHYDGNI